MKNTETFPVTQREWTLAWRTSGETFPGTGMIAIYVHDGQTDELVEIAASHQGVGSASTIIRTPPGRYYLKITAANVHWRIEATEVGGVTKSPSSPGSFVAQFGADEWRGEASLRLSPAPHICLEWMSPSGLRLQDKVARIVLARHTPAGAIVEPDTATSGTFRVVPNFVWERNPMTAAERGLRLIPRAVASLKNGDVLDSWSGNSGTVTVTSGPLGIAGSWEITMMSSDGSSRPWRGSFTAAPVGAYTGPLYNCFIR
jgi:hypothetical protein